ncbi:hypothetical protein LSAT2_015865, partial [Lamellibrachia satsuma]
WCRRTTRLASTDDQIANGRVRATKFGPAAFTAAARNTDVATPSVARGLPTASNVTFAIDVSTNDIARLSKLLVCALNAPHCAKT